MRPWGWVVQYGIAIVFALLLGAILGSILLFKETTLGATGLTASDVVQFLGYGSALFLLWLLARQAAIQIPEDGKGLSFLRHVVIPLATLIVVSAGYSVLRLVVSPFLDETSMTIYNWVFVLGIIGTALWLVLTGFQYSAPLIEAFATLGRTRQSGSPETSLSCPQCSEPVTTSMKFCSHCGQSLASLFCRNCNTPLTPGQRFCGKCGTAVG